jgi:hypothetical protein
MKEKETQTAAMLSLDVQSRFEVRFIEAPLSEGVNPLSECRGTLSNLRDPEKRPGVSQTTWLQAM